MATQKQIERLEKKYGLTVLEYPTWLIKIMKQIKSGTPVIDLNQYMLIRRERLKRLSAKELEAIFVHEKVHEISMPDDVVGQVVWFLKYAFNKSFRFEEELAAYLAEIIFRANLNGEIPEKALARRLCRYYASVMAGDTYRSPWEKTGMCTEEEAYERLIVMAKL